MAGFEIVAVPAFADNYIWLLHDESTGITAVIDPGDGDAALRAAADRGWTINVVLNTHWHPDHVGGNLKVKDAGATIYGPAGERDRIPGLDVALDDGDRLTVGSLDAEVWHVPGHTNGHIAFIFRDSGVAFVGDTLFAMGCGRLFEGTPEQMHASLQRFAALPDDMQLYAAHEYTLSNARFSVAAAPDDEAVADRLTKVERARAEGQATLPTTVAEEKATNLFMRAEDAEQFARLRSMKDSFR